MSDAPTKATLPPKRPYLLRAVHQWITDNAQTPHIVVDATGAGVQVPADHIKDGRIVLNVSGFATNRLELANDAVRFDARFGGVPRHVEVPMAFVVAIYARESGEGLVFPPEEYAGPPGAPDDPSPPPAPGGGRPNLKVVR